MVNLRRSIVLAASLLAISSALADDQKPPAQQTYVPRLNDIMVATQLRHFKLWYAGTIGNWPLANYELMQIRSSIEDSKDLYPDKSKSDMSAMMPIANDLDNAIKAKDGVKFAAGFRKMTGACNACHEAAGVGFIKIRDPKLSPLETSPFSDESFSGQ
jgi:cytochrome c553